MKSTYPLRIVYVFYAFIIFITFAKNIPLMAQEQKQKQENTGSADYYFSLAETFRHENATNKALFYYKKTLESKPNHFESLFNTATILFKQTRYDEAIEYYHQALTCKPDCAEIYSSLGVCYIKQKNIDKGINYFKTALTLDPKDPHAHFQIGIIYEQAKQYQQALKHYKQASLSMHNDGKLFHHIARMYKQLDELEKAIPFYKRSLEHKPDQLNVIVEYANTLNMLEHNQQALALYMKALEINPNMTSVMYNFGFTLKKLGHIDKAIEVYKKVIAKRPDYSHANFSLSLAYLTLGDFEHGWPAYEWRWAAYKEKPKRFDSPLWDGSNPSDKTILLYAEQGFGDTFQFIRYAKILKDQGATIILETQNALETLLNYCPYIDLVIKRGTTPPPHDCHLALMSLPFMFKTHVDTVPVDIPYLYTSEKVTNSWRKKLAQDNNFKIGLCWQGNAYYRTQALKHAVALKSLHVKHFEPLADVEGIHLYSLQKMNGTDQLRDISFEIHEFDSDFDATNGRFVDTAAVMKNLDLIITIDTSIGHLAGALGVPVWVILPKPADWRWMLDRDDTPWYPTMRLFRQHKQGEWGPVMLEIVEALKITLDKKTPSSKQQKKNVSELQSLSRLQSKINEQLIKLDQELKSNTYSVFDNRYAELARQIVFAHKLKNQITSKMNNVNQN